MFSYHLYLIARAAATRHTKHGRLRPGALSEVRGGGPRGATPRPRSVVAGRRHPASEVRGGGREELPATEVSGSREETPRVRGKGRREETPGIRGQGGQPRGSTLRARPGTAARRSHLVPEARGGGPEEPPHAGGQGLQPGGDTLGWRPGVVAGRSNPRSSGFEGPRRA